MTLTAANASWRTPRAVQMGLSMVNPEGPMASPIPVGLRVAECAQKPLPAWR